MIAGFVAVGVVLRGWNLTHVGLTPDETYSTWAAHRPFFEIPSVLWDSDPHPPIYYLTLTPFERLSHAEWVLRAPSFVASVGALILFALWQRRHGVAGRAAIAVFALAPYQAFFASQVRMYGAMTLAGVLGAMASDRWLRDSGRRWVWCVAAASVLAAMGHAIGVVFAAAFVLVPLLRRDREAWIFRLAAASGPIVWLATWGSRSIRTGSGSLYSTPDLDSVTIALNQTLVSVPSNRFVILPIAIVGAAALTWKRDSTARIWWLCFVVPTLVLLVVSFHASAFIPKSLAIVSWGIPVAVGSCIALAWDRLPVLGLGISMLVALLVLPNLPVQLERLDDLAEFDVAFKDLVVPGDLFVSHPPTHVTHWYAGIEAGGREDVDGHLMGLQGEDVEVWRVPGAPATGRVWVFDVLYVVDELEVADVWSPCGVPLELEGGYLLRCYEAAATDSS